MLQPEQVTGKIKDEVYASIYSHLAEEYPNSEHNVGWEDDEIRMYVSTKIYGEGILTTSYENYPTIEHSLEPF